MPDITDHENYRFLESLTNSANAKAQQAEYPDSPMKTTVGVIENGNDADTEGFLLARKKTLLDDASESFRGALKVARAAGPSASVAGLGALMGGVPSGGVGAGPGALMALGAKGIYDAASGLVVNPLSRLFTGKELLPSSNALSDRMMDKLGVPYPESRAEEVMTNLIRAGMDAFGGGPAAGKLIADMAPAGTVTKWVGTVMQEAPAMQVLGGMAGQGAVEAIDPEGRSPTLDTFAALAGGTLPFLARGIPQALYGKRAMTPEYQNAMRRALDARSLEVSNSNIEMTPRQVEGFIRDAESSNSLSAGIRGLTQGRGFFEPMQNRLAVKNVERNILENVLNPSDVVENINRVQAGNIEGEIPGLRLRSDSLSNDTGVTAALSPANSNPRSIQRGLTNQAALSGYATDIAAPNPTTPGAFNEAASQRQAQFLDQPTRVAADAGTQVAEQQRLLQEIQNAKATAEAELKRLQTQIAERGSSLERGASSEATAAEYWKKYEALQKQMEDSKLPSELSKPISTTPLVEGIQESKGMSATALERPNPLVSETEQQLRRFGVEPTTTGEAPTMSKTVIAASPAAAEGASVPPPASGMSEARAAQIEAGIAAMPEPKGPVKYLGGSSPVESVTKTPGGQFVKVRRKIVEFDDVARSGDSAHPPEYQNRNREEIASQNQVNTIFSQFNPPETTGSHPSTGTGAPIVGPQKNVLEGGHGRMMVLERVLKDPAAAAKRAAYIDELTRAGHDVSGFKNPVEVQERVTPLTPAQVESYVADMNRPTVAQLSTGDMARADSGRMMKGAIAKLDPTKPLDHPANAEFVREMNVGLGSTELQPYINTKGGANSTLVKRYQDGLNQAAYGGRSAGVGGEPSAAEALLRSMRDDTDPMVKSIAGAMDDASGGFAKLRMLVESGQIDAKYDLGNKVAEAANFVRQARLEGQHPMDMLNQATMFGGPDPAVRSIVELFYNEGSRRQVGTKALGQTLNSMAADAMNQKADLFGGSALRSPEQIVQMAKQDIGSSARATEAAAIAAANPQLPMGEAAPAGVGAKRTGKKAQASADVLPEQTSMMKEADTAPPAESTPGTSPGGVDAVSVMSAPPEQFRVQNALELLDSYKAKMRAAERTGGPEWANIKRNLQPIISRIEAQIKAETTAIQASKEAYAEASPDLIHGLPSQLRKAGAAGDPQNIHQSRTLDLWFNKNGASSTEAKQLAKIMGDTPDNIDAVRQYVMSRVAAETGEAVTGAQIRSWKKTHDQILSQPEFSPIGEELRKYANQLDGHSSTINQAGKDIAAERLRLQELESSRTAAESNLERQRGISEEAGGMRVASGKSDKINQVLSDPGLAREAVATANTPAARADLDNQIRAVVDRRLKNNGVNADRPVGAAAPTVDELNVSMAKTVRTLLEGEGRQALETLTSPTHVRRLDMLANALEAESKPSKMLRGSITGSPTQQYTAVDRAAQASSSFYRRITQTALQVLNDTNTYRQFLTDVQLNPELLKQITLMHQAKDPNEIGRVVRAWAKTQGRMTGAAAQLDRGWRKREQDNEESGEAPSAPDEKE